jgi:hypothetical protein
VLSPPKHASEARCVPVIRCVQSRGLKRHFQSWDSTTYTILLRHFQADKNTAGFRNVGLGKTSMMESVRNPNDFYCHTQSSEAFILNLCSSYCMDGLDLILLYLWQLPIFSNTFQEAHFAEKLQRNKRLR